MKKKEYKDKRGNARRKKALMRKNSSSYRKLMKENIIMILVGILGLVLLILLIFGVRAAVRNIGEKRALRQAEKERLLEEQKTIRIGATGCMLLHDAFLESEWYTEDKEHYDFSDIFKFITPYYETPDFMTCEFEGALPGGNYSGYPSFASPDDIIRNIRDAGVDLQLLSTNHVYDEGSRGLHRTMDVYDENEINYTGIRQKNTDKNYFITEIKGVKIGFINYVYETNGEGVDLNNTTVAEADEDLINTFDYEELETFYKEIQQSLDAMRAEGAEFLIANMHWGLEYQLNPSKEQETIAQTLCDMGVDAIIGGHPHCEQPIDLIESVNGNKTFCIYSVGNTLSNQRKDLISSMPQGHTEDGVMVTLVLRKEEDGVRLKEVQLLPTWVYCEDTQKGNKYYILPLDDVENLEEKTGLTGFTDAARASYERSMRILKPGLDKTEVLLNAD